MKENKSETRGRPKIGNTRLPLTVNDDLLEWIEQMRVEHRRNSNADTVRFILELYKEIVGERKR